MPAHSRRAGYALRKLAEDDPALGVLALWCRHRDSDGHVAPAWSAGDVISYGPGFELLEPHVQVGLAAHHVLHIAFRHGPRSRAMFLRFGNAFEEDVYNIAADAIVNETLLLARYALPRPSLTLGGLLEATGSSDDRTNGALSRIDTDALYVMLLHERQTGRSRQDTDPASPVKRADRIRDIAAQQGFARDLVASEEPSDDASDRNQAAEWQQRIAQAMDAGRRAGRGIGTLGFRIADLPEVRTPWQTLLRGLVSKALLQERYPSYRRPSRRWLATEGLARQRGTSVPVFQPSLRQDHEQPRIAVALDSSGSIDDVRLRQFAAQLAAIARRTSADVHLLVFDEVVQSERLLGGPDWIGEIGRIDFSREGGTSFVDVIERACVLDPSIIVVLTDLEGPFGEAPRGVPVLWAVPSLTDRKPPFGRVISLAH